MPHARPRGRAVTIAAASLVLLGLGSVVGPANVLGAQRTTFAGLGRLQRRTILPAGVFLEAEHGGVLVEAIAGIGVRVRVRFGDAIRVPFPAVHSLATGDSLPRTGVAHVGLSGDTVVMNAEGLVVRATPSPLRLRFTDAGGHELISETLGALAWQGRVAHVVAQDRVARYFGVGEQPFGLERSGSTYPFWNTDRGIQPGQTPVYSSFPFILRVKDGVAHGMLYDNPFKAELDVGARFKDALAYTAEGGIDGGELRYYVFRGPGLDSVMARYTRLTGRTPLPPRWALGYHQSRYSYHPDTQVVNLATEFRRRGIPADVIHLDIHFMNGYRVFTWNPVEFPHPKRLLDTLRSTGFRVVTIVDPGVKIDSGYRVYRDGLAQHAYVLQPDGTPLVGEVWPGRSVFPDFSRSATRRWWGDQHHALVDSGVAGVWNDMNEPASFGGQTISDVAQFDGDGRPGTHLEYHNQYGTLEARATYEGLRRLRPNRRPFIVTRAGYTGVQRYASMWTGDTYATWDELRISLPMVLSLGLSGLPFAGDDIGGFNGSPSPELYSRWLQSAALLPFCRTHSSIDSPRREPWLFGPEHERANRATIRLRYRLMPVLYTAFFQHTRDGSPVVRPVFWQSLDDSAALREDQSFLLGDHLLVAPVVDSGADSRRVHLPAGAWYRLGSDERFAGGSTITVSAPRVSLGDDTTGLRGLPVFARAGAVVPTQEVLDYTDQRVLDTLSLRVFPGTATSEVYEDEGDGYSYAAGNFRLTAFATVDDGHRLTATIVRRGQFAGAHTFRIAIPLSVAPRQVVIDGREIQTVFDGATHEVRFNATSTISRIDVIR